MVGKEGLLHRPELVRCLRSPRQDILMLLWENLEVLLRLLLCGLLLLCLLLLVVPRHEPVVPLHETLGNVLREAVLLPLV